MKAGDWQTLIIPGIALFVSMLSLYFSRKSWFEANRPIITVRVARHSGGNMATALDLIVENTGSRPAKNIKLSADDGDLRAAFVKDANETEVHYIKAIFTNRGIIPILANGRSAINSFGHLSRSTSQPLWVMHSRFDIQVTYHDLNDREYSYSIPIFIADDKGFAGGFWSSKSD
jgi:hypothetical protein